jgi:light-regulated signal transduction histidine kinase (bacteriophytochrome)
MPGRKHTEDEEGGSREGRLTGDRALSEFLLRLCHDLKTSLRAIRAPAELLLREGESPGTSAFEQRLAFIIDGAMRVDLLATGLTNYSLALQIDPASFQSTRMDTILRAALARLNRELRDNDSEVTHGELPPVSGNPDRLVQVFENLLSNALRHRGPASPRIHITAEKQAEEWLFSVRDNGPGVEAAYLKSIFKPFERLHGKERKGVGLGLAICQAVVERHGGRLWAESKPGTGLTFFFTLPQIDP